MGKEVRKEIWENGVNWEFGRLEGGSKGKKEGFATSEREEKKSTKRNRRVLIKRRKVWLLGGQDSDAEVTFFCSNLWAVFCF